MMKEVQQERARLMESRILGKDDQGREVLIGLTVEETAFCVKHRRRLLSTDLDVDGIDKERFMELMEKHKRAQRLLVIPPRT